VPARHLAILPGYCQDAPLQLFVTIALSTAFAFGVAIWSAETMARRRGRAGDTLSDAGDRLEVDKAPYAQYRTTGERDPLHGAPAHPRSISQRPPQLPTRHPLFGAAW
jgi:hypothetical protein